MEFKHLGHLIKLLECHLDSSAFKTRLLNKSLYLELEDLGHLAKILNVHLDSSAFKSKLVNKSL